MVLLVALLLAEVVLTLWDFVVEDWIRKPLGGVYAGERVMHGIMGIVYGAMLANMVPTLRTWWAKPTGFVYSPAPISGALRWVMILMAVGVFLSGVRDFCAAAGMRYSAWPWVSHKQ